MYLVPKYDFKPQNYEHKKHKTLLERAADLKWSCIKYQNVYRKAPKSLPRVRTFWQIHSKLCVIPQLLSVIQVVVTLSQTYFLVL